MNTAACEGNTQTNIELVKSVCCVSSSVAATALRAYNGDTSAAIERILSGSAPQGPVDQRSPARQSTLAWPTSKSKVRDLPAKKTTKTGSAEDYSLRDVAEHSQGCAAAAADVVHLISSDEDSDTTSHQAPAAACNKRPAAPAAQAGDRPQLPRASAASAPAAAAAERKSTVDATIEDFDPWAHAQQSVCIPSSSAATGCAPLAYSICSDAFQAVDSTKSRLRIMDMLTNLFRAILAHDYRQVLPAVFLAGNKLATEAGSVDLGVGGSAVAAAVREVTGASRAQMSQLYKTHGDLGDVAAALKQKQRLLLRPKPLTVPGVHKSLLDISKKQGKGSAAGRNSIMCSMLRSCSGSETQYFVRTLLQHLRIGVSMDTILASLARASALHASQTVRLSEQRANDGEDATTALRRFCSVTPSDETAASMDKPSMNSSCLRPVPSAAACKRPLADIVAECKQAYSVCPDPAAIVHALVRPGSRGAATMRATCQARPGQVLKPMLAKIARSTAAPSQTWGAVPFAAEYKYDGQRAQIHVWHDGTDSAGASTTATGYDAESKVCAFASPRNGQGATANKQRTLVRVFSRHLENTTQRWLDVCAELAKLARPATAAARVQASAPPGPVDTWYPCIAAFDRILGAPVAGLQSCILDAEIIGVQPATDGSGSFSIRPFQELSTRARVVKTDGPPKAGPQIAPHSAAAGAAEASAAGPAQRTASSDAAGVQVCCVVFDVIQWNGVSLQACPLWFRRAVLLRHLRCSPGKLQLAEQIVTQDTAKLQKYLEQSVDDACEGLMLKLLGDPSRTLPAAVQSLGTDAPRLPSVQPPEGSASSSAASADNTGGKKRSRVAAAAAATTASSAGAVEAEHTVNMLGAGYEPAKRSDAWLKLKKDYIEGMGDTLDLVPVAGWWGNGRKAGWFSPILLAAYDAENEQFCSVCRCMSGFSDEFYKRITAFYSKPENQSAPPSGSTGPPLGISTSESPAVWFRPCAVWELKGADFSLSPVHTAGMGLVSASRGISVRFPRFVREREDKGPEDCTSVEELADFYLAQARRVKPAP